MDTSAPESTAGTGVAGRVLGGRYELGAAIGRGGSAVVYRALDRRDGRAVAVKVFAPAVEGVPGHRREREMALLSELDHPGLVAVLDAGVDDAAGGHERPFLVMQLVEGTTLAAYRERGAMPEGQVIRIGRELAAGLAHVHSHGITHRDVTPANVLLDRTGRARLTDFGIAVLVDQTRITATGAVIGTAAYMSPEQVCGDPVGPPTDVYALGLVLLEFVTGRPAYSGTGREVAVARITRRPAVPPDLAEPLGRLLAEMTADRPTDRPTAAEVASALDVGERRTMVVTIPPPQGPEVGTRRHHTAVGPPVDVQGDGATARSSAAGFRHRPLLAAAGLLIAAGLAGAGVWSLTGETAADGGGAATLSPVEAPPVGSVLPPPYVDPEPVRATATAPSPAPAVGLAAVPSPGRTTGGEVPPHDAGPPARSAATPPRQWQEGDGPGNSAKGNSAKGNSAKGNGNGGKGNGKGNGKAGKGSGRGDD